MSSRMARVIIILFILGVLPLSSSQTEDPMKMIERVMRTCRDRYKIQSKYTDYWNERKYVDRIPTCKTIHCKIGEIENAIKNKRFPMGERGRGFLMCIIKEVGFNQLKNMIRGSTRGKLSGQMASLIELPEFEKELEETTLHMAIAK